MSRLVNLFLFFMLVLGGILIAGLVFLHYTNLDSYRKHIENIATRAIGRQIEINGHIELNLYPHPEVIINDVFLANAKWGTEPTMVSVGHGDFAINFWSLFSDTILLRRVRLNDVSVLLERNDQRVGNWVMETNAPSAGPEERTDQDHDEIVVLPLMVDRVESSNISVIVRAPERTDQVYHVSSLSLQPDNTGNLILKSSGELLGNSMILNGEITSRESIIANGAVKLDLQASLGDAHLTGQMSTSRLATLTNLHGNINIAVHDIQKALKKAKIEAPLTGALTADFSVADTAGDIDVVLKAKIDGANADATAKVIDARLHAANLKLKIDDVQKLFNAASVEIPLAGPLTSDATINIDGSAYKATVETKVDGITTTVDGAYSGKQLDLSSTLAPLARVGELFDLKGISTDTFKVNAKVAPSTANDFEIKQFQANVGNNQLTAQGRIAMAGESNISLTLASPNLKDLWDTLPDIDLNAKVSTQYSAEKIALSEMILTFDKSDIKGDFTMFKGDKKNVTANLTSTLLDLRPFSKTSQPDGAPPESIAEALPETSAEPENRYVFKEAPLQLVIIQDLEADVNLAVNHLYYDRFEFKEAVFDATAHSGHVDAKLKARSDNEGHAAAKIDLKTQGEKATLSAVVSLSDYRKNFRETERLNLAEMPLTSMSLKLETAGASPRELASVANGRILITQGPGKMDNAMMEMYSGDIFAQLFGALDPLAKDEEFSNWDCTIVSANIVDGQVTFDGMLAQSEKVMIVGGGSIDLKTEKLNVEFNTKPRSGVGMSADLLVKPFVKLKGTLASPGIGLNEKGTLLSGGAAIATGGTSLLVETAFDRATAEGDQCEKTLEIVGDHIRYAF